MREAVVVSVARTPIGKAYRGAFNDTSGPGARPGAPYVRRRCRDRLWIGLTNGRRVIGWAMQQGVHGQQISGGRPRFAPGYRSTVAGIEASTEPCSSGLMAIATAAKEIVVDGMDVRSSAAAWSRSRWCRTST